MDRSVDAVIIGMGYVGLPLAREASAAGLSVIGLDTNPEVVDGLNHGRSHIDDLGDSDVAEMLERGFFASIDARQLRRAQTIVVCVPTPLSSDGAPDLAPLRAAAVSVAEHLQPRTLVILESTTYPGTTDEEIRPILEAGHGGGWEDFWLVFRRSGSTPATSTSGPRTRRRWSVATHPPAPIRLRHSMRFIDTVVRTKGTREAETAKLLENTYRHINIALVNEMARFCHPPNRPLGRNSCGKYEALRIPAVQASPDGVGTAYRLTPTTCPTACEPGWAIRSGSWNWRRRSMPPCPATLREANSRSAQPRGRRCEGR